MALFRRRFTARGAPPGVVVAADHGQAPEITVIAYDGEQLVESQCVGVSDLPSLGGDGMVHWVHVRGLGDGEIVQRLGEKMHLHSLAVSDVVNVGQRPKVEEYGDVLFVVLHTAMVVNGRLQLQQVSLFVGNDFVLTFQETHEDCLAPLRDRIRAGRRRIRTSGSGFLAAMVVDTIVDGYFPALEQYGESLEEYEVQVLEEEQSDVLGELYKTRRDLASFRRAVWPLREALSHLVRLEDTTLSEPVRLHLRDTLDHTMQVVDVIESYRELAASLVDIHISMVGQRTNDIMRVLTVVSAIFIPLTFVAGIYGMNFDTSHPGNLPELGWPRGYLFFWCVCAGLAVSLLLLFRRLGWLTRRD